MTCHCEHCEEWLRQNLRFTSMSRHPARREGESEASQVPDAPGPVYYDGGKPTRATVATTGEVSRS